MVKSMETMLNLYISWQNRWFPTDFPHQCNTSSRASVTGACTEGQVTGGTAEQPGAAQL